MSNNAIYLAGFPKKYPEKVVLYLKMIHNSGDRRPYLTHNANGLKLTRYHANLYVLTQDHSKVRCVQPCNLTPTTFSIKEETT